MRGTREFVRRLSSSELMAKETKFVAPNYKPVPVVFSQASGVHVVDPEGKKYYDFASAFSAMNQGHCHPRIVAAMKRQADKLTLSSRGFYNEAFAQYAEYVTKLFGYDRVLPGNCGVEAVEGAVKLARKWAYEVKGVPTDEAIIVSFKGCFHGRTIAAVSLCSDDIARVNFGPLVPGIARLPFNDLAAVETLLEKQGKKVAAVLIEPIQGEAGVLVGEDGYLRAVAALCKKHNVLLIADEIQCGLGRAGKLLASHYSGIKPDMVILGKALSGGLLPVSSVLGNDNVMTVVKPGQHGSTFAGNPLASAVAMESLQVILDEKLVEKSFQLGEHFRARLRASKCEPLVHVRGRGLMNAIDIRSKRTTALDVCLKMAERGLVTRPTHDYIIRLAPPLTITQSQLDECTDILVRTVSEMI